MSNSIVEKEWITKAGFAAKVLMVMDSHRCGYVALPSDHPLYGIYYMDLPIDPDVHGGITYTEFTTLSDDTREWWVGFDCAHVGDATRYSPFGVHRSLAYVEEECESLAKQLHNYKETIMTDHQNDTQLSKNDLADKIRKDFHNALKKA